MIIESCVETVEQAIRAAQGGATQLELCADLDHDGLTPTDICIQNVLSNIRIPVKVMIRCRDSNFIYSEEEISAMTKDIHRIRQFPIAGFVFGALHNVNGKLTLDMEAIRTLCEAAYPYPITIHKAIDLCSDILNEIPKLKDINNIRYILSSGGQATAYLGQEMLAAMQSIAAPEISIIAAGKITHQNLYALHNTLNLAYYHGRLITDMS